MEKWQYLIINSNLVGRVFIPHFVGTDELPNWQNGPGIHTVLNELGEQGWELVNAFIESSNFFVILKKLKPHDARFKRLSTL